MIAIDRFVERLQLAEAGNAEVIDYEKADFYDKLMEMTNGRGPDRCIDAVGSEAHPGGFGGAYDSVKQRIHLDSDRPHVIREALKRC